MNILLIFRNNPFATSGAVSLDLFNELKAKGHNVRMLVNYYKPGYPADIISMETALLFWKKKVINKFKRTFGKTPAKITNDRYHFHAVDEREQIYSTDSLLKKAGIKPDAIIVLFASDFINAKNIHELNKKTGKPVYWMMYDTSPLTGGCHYSWECEGYQKACGSCPGIYSKDPQDATYKNLAFKKEYMDKTDVSIVLASEWQQRQATKSAVFKNREIHKVLISINPDVFKPVARTESRSKFGIPVEKKVIFFGAKSFHDERKGFKYLLEALNIFRELCEANPQLLDKVHLLIAGEETEKFKTQLPFEYTNLGMLNNSDGVASAYQAADVYICPSIEDAGPSMVNQSVMCGTPVVSFAQGVSLDIVITGKTGHCALLKDSRDMAKGIYNILSLSDDDHDRMRKNCRETAMEMFGPEVSINKWLKIIKAV